MIVKMRQVTVLASRAGVDSVLKKLRGLGVLHVSYLKKPEPDSASEVRTKLSQLEKALEIASLPEKEKKLNRQELGIIPEQIINLAEEKNNLKKQRQELEAKKKWFDDWGDVTKTDLEKIAEKNVFISLYFCGKKEFERNKKNKLVYLVKKKKGVFHLALVAKDKPAVLNFGQRVEPPEKNREFFKAKIKEIDGRIKEIEKALKELSSYRHCLLAWKKELMQEFEFVKVKSGMGADEALVWLRGYCPLDSVKRIEEAAGQNGWGLVVAEPDDPGQVPTLLKNPRWVEIIKPVFKFMGTLPGYKEYDISFWFLLFFSLFFAMIVGDAGYGLIFLLATYLAGKKLKKIPATFFFLSYTLSFATVAWGALSGNWFGAEAFSRLPGFNFLILDRINSFVEGNQSFMIYFSFVIGAVHLSLAHLMKAFRYFNSLKAVAEIGWISILWAAFFLAGKLVLNRPVPDFALPLGVAGITAVIVFSNFKRNILKGALSSLGTLPLDVVSSFSDIVSYLRLFAVGYATVAVASAFNTMAAGAAGGGFLGGLAAAFILFLGHTLNILLCLMSVIVHGIRLNMLEFSGQLGMEWSGVEYKPFSR